MEKDAVVYRDARYTLGIKDDKPYLTADGRVYLLGCHPYEPCLYITDERGALTAVHNAFDPRAVLALAADGKTFTSITGFEYDARDFCEMAAYAAGKGDVGIETAERVFGSRPKKKGAAAPPAPDRTEASPEDEGPFRIPTGVHVIENDPFFAVLDAYPRNVIDFCLVRYDRPYDGRSAHLAALLLAADKLLAACDCTLLHTPGKTTARPLSAGELFAPAGDAGKRLNYRYAFLLPPCPGGYTDADFERLNDALFPRGRDLLTAFSWPTDWSDYFDDGREWWGTLCYTVYDRATERFVVIMASATD